VVETKGELPSQNGFLQMLETYLRSGGTGVWVSNFVDRLLNGLCAPLGHAAAQTLSKLTENPANQTTREIQ
jgi:hypothetical protein